MLPIYVLLRWFYFVFSEACRHALDVMVGGSFVEYDEIKYLHIIDGLVAFPMNTKIDGITDRFGKIENILSNLYVKEEEKTLKSDQILEIEGDREPYVKIVIKEQTFLAYCDVGSMMCTMPKIVFDSLNFGDFLITLFIIHMLMVVLQKL